MKRNIFTALIMGVIIPWILTFLFLTFLTDINWTQLTEGIPQYLAVLSFGSVGFAYNVPIFGYSYTIPLIIWVITGIFCGLLCKSALKGVVVTLIGLLINIFLFVVMNAMIPNLLPSITPSLESALTTPLLGGLSVDFLITLGLFLSWYSLTLPGSVLGGIMGGLISRTGVAE